MKNLNPGGNTIITEAKETTAEANGEFERFEAFISNLVQTPRQERAEQPREAVTGSQ
jgi:hypothetical protein